MPGTRPGMTILLKRAEVRKTYPTKPFIGFTGVLSGNTVSASRQRDDAATRAACESRAIGFPFTLPLDFTGAYIWLRITPPFDINPT